MYTGIQLVEGSTSTSFFLNCPFSGTWTLLLKYENDSIDLFMMMLLDFAFFGVMCLGEKKKNTYKHIVLLILCSPHCLICFIY